MKSKNIIAASFLLCFSSMLFSQNILTEKEVIKNTLEKNFGIKVARTNVEIARNNTDKKANGYSPTLNASVNPTASLGSGLSTFNGPLDDAEINNAFSWTAAANVSANYTLFDKTRDYNLEQLKETLNLSDLQLRQTIEANILQVLNGYYEVARLSENISVFENAFEVSSRRLERAQYRYEYGQGIQLDILNAQVDIQRDSINLLNARQQLSNAKGNLNYLMGTSMENTFEVDTTLNYQGDLSVSNLIQSAQKENIAILAADQNLVIREMDLKIIDAGRKPTIGANANYNYNYQDNAEGSFIATNRTNGLNAGVTLNWNIFDGGRRNLQEQNTQLAIRNQLTQKDELKLQLERDVMNAWENFQNALFVLNVEKNSLQTNQANLNRTQELFNAGQVSSVEFRQAQLNLLNSSVNYNAAKYNAKLIELQLLQLSGGLMESIE